jgi:flagellar protein FliJ
MPAYRFRAQAALDLRRKQDDEAQRALGEARRATLLAQRVVQRAEEDLAKSLRLAREKEGEPANVALAIWYRNWMRRQKLTIVAARQALDRQRDVERAAAEQAAQARRRLRSLERLRDRTWQAFLMVERRVEQKELDQLGTLQYVARTSVSEGA